MNDSNVSENCAYIVTGPVSSGNRLITSILIRSGCKGDSGTNQRKASAAESSICDYKTN